MATRSAAAAASGSRERMLEAAIDLMRGTGLTGAGINEIVRASGSPKGSVYHFFPQGKLQIAAEALGVYSELVQQFIETSMARGRDPAGRIEALFEAFARRVEDSDYERSCAVGTVSLDLGGEAAALQPLLARTLGQWTEAIAAALGPGVHARALAGLALSAIEGAYVRARAEHSSRAFREAGTLLSQLARQAV